MRRSPFWIRGKRWGNSCRIKALRSFCRIIGRPPIFHCPYFHKFCAWKFYPISLTIDSVDWRAGTRRPHLLWRERSLRGTGRTNRYRNTRWSLGWEHKHRFAIKMAAMENLIEYEVDKHLFTNCPFTLPSNDRITLVAGLHHSGTRTGTFYDWSKGCSYGWYGESWDWWW